MRNLHEKARKKHETNTTLSRDLCFPLCNPPAASEIYTEETIACNAMCCNKKKTRGGDRTRDLGLPS